MKSVMEANITLRSLSVVILAEYHNPSILNTNFVVSNDIVNKEWRTVETVTTPGLSILKYDNGVQLAMNPNRLSISVELDERLHEHHNNEIYHIAIKYVNTLPHISYRSLGLNCILQITQDEPLKWLTERFLNADSYNDGLYMLPKFIKDLGENKIGLDFNYQNTSDENSIVIDCNSHHIGPFTSSSLCQKIEEWPTRQKDIQDMIDNLIQGDKVC